MTSVYKVLFSDNASTTLAAGITNNSPSMQVLSGSGALFPVLGNAQAFVCTLVKNGAPTIREVVLVTGHAAGSDNFTGLVRNLSHTGALSWNAGDTVELRPTAEAMSYFAQFTDLQAQQTNYTLDTGSANNYQAYLNPLPNASIVGMPIRWKASHTNTGPSGFSDGITSAPLVMPEGNALVGGDIVAGGLYVSVWDGTRFQLISNHHYAFPQIGGQVSNGQVTASSVLQWESLLSIGFSQLSGSLLAGQMPANYNLPGSPTTTTQAVGDSGPRIATTEFANPARSAGNPGYFKTAGGDLVMRGSVHIGDIVSPIGGSINFPTSFGSNPIVTVSLLDTNSGGATCIATVEGSGPSTTGFSWAAREIASFVQNATLEWHAVGSS